MTAAATPPTDRFTILYDPDCGFCRTALALILRADTRRRLTPLALGTAAADTLLADLTPQQRAGSWHLVSPAGERTSAGAAGPPLLRLLPGGTLPAAILAAAPNATDRSYRWIADHRSTLSRALPAAAKQRATQLIAQRMSGPR